MGELILPAIPIGFRFQPNDQEIIDYLRMKVFSQVLPCNIIVECDFYDDKEPWLIFDTNSDEEYMYFFSCNKKKFGEDKKKLKRIAGCGTWKLQGAATNIYNEPKETRVVGFKKALKFIVKKGSASSSNGNGVEKDSWIMHEYTLNDVAAKDNNYTLCKIRRIISKESREIASKQPRIHQDKVSNPLELYTSMTMNFALSTSSLSSSVVLAASTSNLLVPRETVYEPSGAASINHMSPPQLLYPGYEYHPSSSDLQSLSESSMWLLSNYTSMLLAPEEDTIQQPMGFALSELLPLPDSTEGHPSGVSRYLSPDVFQPLATEQPMMYASSSTHRPLMYKSIVRLPDSAFYVCQDNSLEQIMGHNSSSNLAPLVGLTLGATTSASLGQSIVDTTTLASSSSAIQLPQVQNSVRNIGSLDNDHNEVYVSMDSSSSDIIFS